MTDTNDRLNGMLADEVERAHPVLAEDWVLDVDNLKFRMTSPVEPCGECGHRVYLILADGADQPHWVRIGDVQNGNSLFPSVQQVRHECGDGDSWSVEAALFVETAMASWAVA
jgi:hypothetical protein